MFMVMNIELIIEFLKENGISTALLLIIVIFGWKASRALWPFITTDLWPFIKNYLAESQAKEEARLNKFTETIGKQQGSFEQIMREERAFKEQENKAIIDTLGAIHNQIAAQTKQGEAQTKQSEVQTRQLETQNRQLKTIMKTLEQNGIK